MAPPQSTILSRADWERIQSAAKECTRREVDHQKSRAEERRQKARWIKIQAAKKLKEEKEERLNMLAAEEVESKRQDWQQAVDKANIKRFYDNGCVRKFNRALLLTHVQKENELRIEFNREKQRINKEKQRQSEEGLSCRQEEALRQEQEKARQRQLYNQAVAKHQAEQMKEKKQVKEKERQMEKEERDRLRALDELHAQEVRHQAKKKAESKKSVLKFRLDDISNQNFHREKQAQALIIEEKKIKCVQSDIEATLQQRKNYQEEMFRKRQIKREIVTDKFAVTVKEEAATTALREEAKFVKAVAEKEAELAKQKKDKKEKRAAMLQSISAHRKAKIQERDLRKKEEHENNLDWFQAQRESTRLFLEKAELKAQKTKQKQIQCQDFNLAKMAESQAHLQQLKREEHDAAKKDAELIAEKEKHLQEYIQHELSKAADSQRNVGHLLAASTGGRGFMVDGEEPGYICKGTGESMPRFATDQTRFMKQYLERDRLQLTYVETGREGDLEPTHFPLISKAIRVKSTDTSALKQTTRERCSPTVGMEGSNYLSIDTGESLPRLATDKTRSTKQNLEQNKLQLTYKENSKTDFQSTPLPPISTEEVPAGRRRSNVGRERSSYCSIDTGESLPRLATDETRRTKQYLERNKLQLTYMENSNANLQSNPLPPSSIKEVTAGQRRSSVGKERSSYCATDTGELLPRFATDKTRMTKQYVERNKLQLTYMENSNADLQSSSLPPISIKKVTAGPHCLPAGVEGSHSCCKGTGESLPRLATDETQSTKQYVEQNKLQLTDEENGKANFQLTPLPPISIKKVPAGPRCLPAGVEGSDYRCKGTGESLPRLATAKTRLTKQYLERNKLQLTYMENSNANLQSNPLPPSSIKEVPAGQRRSSVGKERSSYCATDTGESLPRFATDKTRMIKQYVERNKLQLTYEENSKANFQSTPLPPISTKKVPAGPRCLPAGVKGSHYCCKGTGESLPRLATAKTQLTKQYLERNKLQLTDEENGKANFQLTPLPPISIKKVPAGPRCLPAGVEGSDYRCKGTGESLPRFSTDKTRLTKQYVERNKLQLTYMENSNANLQSNPLPPISIKKVPAGPRCLPAGVEGSDYRCKGTGESLPRLATAKTQLTKQYLERNKLQLTDEENGKANFQLTPLPPISIKKVPAGPRCLPAGVEGSDYRCKGTGESLPRFSTDKTRLTKQYVERNKLQLTYMENSKANFQSNPLPPISTKKVPAGPRCLPAGVEGSDYRCKGTGESLPRLATAKTRLTKQYLERNKLQLT
ncbi:uncharacterized protein LOC121883424 isoform X1 [Thunnus maccoyii]|uniref:uncharacterized protein LOC121883424 isoform X1 n=1 Tax=Thunnus maccoyii TaxID=8240 RepID=UPI001C4AE225|nr:uncharacterized protein LOC121883424 isoform X1 [Thunnus maccoyii]